MRPTPRGLAHGVVAAFQARRVVRGRALDVLLAPPPFRSEAARTPDAHTAALAHEATAVAFAALRTLRHLPGWRNTCLYRAVAECLVLRAHGLPATLQLGVARSAEPSDAVTAHAWVECPGHRCRARDGGGAAVYRPFRAPSIDLRQRAVTKDPQSHASLYVLNETAVPNTCVHGESL